MPEVWNGIYSCCIRFKGEAQIDDAPVPLTEELKTNNLWRASGFVQSQMGQWVSGVGRSVLDQKKTKKTSTQDEIRIDS